MYSVEGCTIPRGQDNDEADAGNDDDAGKGGTGRRRWKRKWKGEHKWQLKNSDGSQSFEGKVCSFFIFTFV